MGSTVSQGLMNRFGKTRISRTRHPFVTVTTNVPGENMMYSYLRKLVLLLTMNGVVLPSSYLWL